MDLLFRLKKNIEGFYSIEETKNFFQKDLVIRDKNYFFHTKKMNQLEKDDIIYFAYDGYIVAKAIFQGEIITDKNRDEKFIEGHKLKNIEIIDSSLKLNPQIIKGRGMRYVKNKQIENEINRVLNSTIMIYPDEIKNENLYEGEKKQISVNAYERNLKARQICLNSYGYKCTICDFDFEKTYGEIGKNFIHVHHIKPLSEINEQYKINPTEDLRPVCPNCHAMLHRKIPAYSIDDIKKLMHK